MELIALPLFFVLIAGIINGSFAAPMKYMVKWEEENIWLVFSIWGFLILPWISILIMAPETFNVVSAIPSKLLWTVLFGGFTFGLGQIAFALSFRYIGIGLAFVINISMGTAGSALIPLIWHKGIMGTPYSYAQLVGIVIFVFAVSLGTAAGALRSRNKKSFGEIEDKKRTKKIKPGMLFLGFVLAIVAGAGSVAQGVTYIWANPTISKIAINSFQSSGLSANTITWVIIFSSAWIPYVIYFLFLNLKNHNLSNVFTKKVVSYWFLTICMGIGFWGSLIFFSKASELIGGDLAPTVAWPLFMVFIILTSNFWSWKSGEWDHAGAKSLKMMIGSLVMFVLAIIVFSYSSSLQPKDEETGKKKHNKIHYHHIQHHNSPVHRAQ